MRGGFTHLKSKANVNTANTWEAEIPVATGTHVNP